MLTVFITYEQSYKDGYQKACDDILKILGARPITCREEILLLKEKIK